MASDLLAENEVILNSLQAAYDLAETNKEHALSNFLADRMEAHKKHAWFLRSTLKTR
jgi:starvation-inducible DNA-binding protein